MRNLALSVVLAAATVVYAGCSGSGNGDGGGGGAGGDGTGGIGGDGTGATGGDSGWQQLGGAVTAGGATQFSLAHDGTNPVIAWVEREPNGYQVYVKRWDGSSSSWVELGGALSAKRTTIPRTVEVAVDAGDQPVVAFTDSDLVQLHVRRWLGDDWDGPSASTRGANPSLVVDRNDEPVVAMQSGTDLGDLVVRRWEDDVWVPMGDRLNVFDDKAAGSPSIALDPERSPVVAFTQSVGESASVAQVYVKRWEDDLAWAPIGPSGFPGGLGPRAGDASLDIGNSGEIFVAWVDFSSTLRLYPFVMQWGDDPAWRQVGPTLASVEDGGDEPSLAVIAANPIVAYRTFDQAACQFAVIVKRWDGSGWQQLGEALNEDDCSCELEDQSGCQAVDMTSLVLDGSGNPVVAWQERRRDEPETGTIYVKTLRLPPG